MRDEQPAPVRGDVHVLLAHLDAAEGDGREVATELVVVAEDVDDLVPLRALRSSFWTTSLWLRGQNQRRLSCQPSTMSPTR